MKSLIIILSIFLAVNCMAIAYLIWKSTDGWFRKLLLWFFISLGFAFLVRFVTWQFGWDGEVATIVVMLPVSVFLFALTLYLYENLKQ